MKQVFRRGKKAMVVVRQLAALLLALFLLFVWREVYTLDCFVLALPLIVIFLIAWSTRERAIVRKRCLVRCYFEKRSNLARLFSSAKLITFFAIIFSIVPGIVLMQDILTWDHMILGVLAADSLLLFGLLIALNKMCGSTFRKDMGPVIIRNWAVALNTLIVLAALFYVQFYYVERPAYLNADFFKTVTNATKTVSSDCFCIDWLARFQTEKEATSWWLIVQAQKFIESYWWRLLTWGLFLVSGSLSVWGYSRYLVQVLKIAQNIGGENEW